MPVTFDEVSPGLRRPMGVTLPDEPAPTVLETFSNSFESNAMVEAVDLLTRKHYRSDPNYNPVDDERFKGSRFERDHWYSFVGSRSPEQTADIISRIEREEQRARVSEASGWLGTVADFASGMADPTVLIPAARAVNATRLARMGAGARNVGLASGAAVGIQEGVHQAAQETRTAEQSALAVGGGVVLGGILGGALSGLSRGEAAAVAGKIDNEVLRPVPDPIPAPVPRAAGAAASVREGLTLGDAMGAERALSDLSPVTRLQTSNFDAARAVVRDMADAGLQYRENFEGVPTSIGGTVETRVKMRQAPMAEAFQELDDQFARYWYHKEEPGWFERSTAAMRSEWARLSSAIEEGKLTFAEFKQQVSRAMRRGDQHPIPQVAQAAREFRAKVFEPMGREAVQRGLLENLGVTTAPSYLTRIYNAPKIIAQRNVWTDRLVNYLQRAGGDTSAMTAAEVRSLVDEVTNTILGESAFRAPGLSVVQGPRGPLRARVLNVPDELIEDFLENDIEQVARIYTKTMAADLELFAKYGSVDLKDQLLKLQDEYNAKANNAASDAERTKLKKQYDRSKKDIEALRDRVRGVFALPADPSAIAYRAAKVMQSLNYTRLLGGMTISAIPDLGRAVSRYGMATVLRDGWLPFVHSLSTARLAANEVKLAGTALDMVLDTRAHAMVDLLDDFSRTTKFERAVEGLSSRFGLVSLMAPWNAALKQTTGVVAMSEILRATKAVVAGNATKKQVGNLAASGIDQAMAGRIWRAFAGDEGVEGSGVFRDGVFLPNTENWTDAGAREALRSGIVREVDNLIVTPGLEKPLWISHTLGKVLGQFKSFALSSTQRVLLANLQQRDAATLQGVIVMLGLGALSAHLKAGLREDKTEWTPAQWAAEAFDSSGLGAILMEGNNISEKVTRGTVGLSALTGKQISRFQSRSAVGALAGPSFDLLGDAAQVVGSGVSGDWSASDTHTARSLVPLQNIFYLRKAFDQLEDSYNESLGIPDKRERNRRD